MKFRIERYVLADGGVFFSVMKKPNWMGWKVLREDTFILTIDGKQPSRLESRELALELIDTEIDTHKEMAILRKGNVVVKSSIEYITKEMYDE
jgi:hypothetical protein